MTVVIVSAEEVVGAGVTEGDPVMVTVWVVPSAPLGTLVLVEADPVPVAPVPVAPVPVAPVPVAPVPVAPVPGTPVLDSPETEELQLAPEDEEATEVAVPVATAVDELETPTGVDDSRLELETSVEVDLGGGRVTGVREWEAVRVIVEVDWLNSEVLDR